MQQRVLQWGCVLVGFTKSVTITVMRLIYIGKTKRSALVRFKEYVDCAKYNTYTSGLVPHFINNNNFCSTNDLNSLHSCEGIRYLDKLEILEIKKSSI